EYGCKDTLDSTIEIAAQPVANFDFPDNICERSELFVLNSSTFARSFLWEISGIGTFTTTDLQFSELDPGTYDISLIAIFNEECRDTLSFSQAINVHTAPIADFSYTVNESFNLIGEVRFMNESINASGYF